MLPICTGWLNWFPSRMIVPNGRDQETKENINKVSTCFCHNYTLLFIVHPISQRDCCFLAWSNLRSPFCSCLVSTPQTLKISFLPWPYYHHNLKPPSWPRAKPQPHGKSYTIPILFSFKIPRTPRQDLTTATFKPPLSCHHYFMSSHPHTSFILFSLLCHQVLYSNSRIKHNKTLHFVEIRFAHIWALWESKSTLGGAVSVLAIPIRLASLCTFSSSLSGR